MLALIGVHLALVWFQKHTQFPGPGRAETNVVGVRVMPVLAVKSGAFFAMIGGVLGLMDHKDAEGDVFNVGSDEEVTVMELAQRIKRLCQSDSAIEFVAYEKVYGQSFEDMRRRVPDLRKIRRFTGYRPLISLDQLLELTIRDTCEQMGIPCPVTAATA